MQVQLQAIKFNYDQDLSQTGAFYIRRNETQTVRIPEWQPYLPSTYEASPAAYVICCVPKNMTIQASFYFAGPLNSPVFVRAVALYTDHILGDIEPVELKKVGSSGFLTLQLPNARVSCAGVGLHDVGWRWQFSDQPEIWTDFQITYHRIYTVLALPSAPWEPLSSDATNIHQPWTDVLDHACRWASGPGCDLDNAAKLVTKGFFALGERLLSYDSGGSYAFGRFDCTGFLMLLNTGAGGNQVVNCDDCATVVSTFANVLGCQLSQSSLGLFFYTHPVVLIGAQRFDSTSFIYHSVAWKGQAKETDELFDACLQIDEDLVAPWVPVQPADLPFGTINKGYRFSLVRDAPHCEPIPDHPDYGRRRRKLGQGYIGDVGIRDHRVISELKKIYKYESWPQPQNEELEVGEFSFIADSLSPGSFPEWEVDASKHFQDTRFSNVFHVLFTHRDLKTEQLLAINLYECRKITEANIRLLEVLGRFERPDLKIPSEAMVGDVGFANQNQSVVVFRRRQFLAIVRSAGRREVIVTRIAQILNETLTR